MPLHENDKPLLFKYLTLALLFGVLLYPSNMSSQLYTDCSRVLFPDCEPSRFDSRVTWTTPAPSTSLGCRDYNVTNPLWYRFVAGPGDIEIAIERLECVPGGFFSPGLVVTIWEWCPGFNAVCITASGCPQNNGLPNPFLDFEIPEGLLEVGQIYTLTVSGCDDAVCDFTMEIDAEDLDVPELDDPSVSLSTEACVSDLPPFTYCQGHGFSFRVDNDYYDLLHAQWYWSVNELDLNADATTVSWIASNASGVGTPMVNGEISRFGLATNGIDLNFQETGAYEVCLNLVRTNCGEVLGGPLCQAITIVPPPDMEVFDKFDLCYSYLLDNNWPGPPLPNGDGDMWIAGSISLNDVQSSPLDAEDNYVVTLPTPVDRCGCTFEQQVTINIVGDEDPGEVELFLMECQLPYQWFDLAIYELDEFYNEPARLIQASRWKDFQNIQCDSFIIITVNETDVETSIVETDCTIFGKEFTFMFDGPELQGADFQWIDADSGMAATEVSESASAILPTGNYFVYVSGFIEDLNHNDNSQGTSPLSYISCDFGPFELLNPIPELPQVMPYDTFLCPDEQFNVSFQVDSIVDSLNLTYNWIIPESLMDVDSYSTDSTQVTFSDISIILPQDTVALYSMGECAVSDTLLVPVELLIGEGELIFPDRIECVGQTFNLDYLYTPGSTYDWDFSPGTTTGNTSDGSPFQVTYDQTGDFQYSLSITTSDGCIAESGPYNISIFNLPPPPEISCNDQDNPNSITFSWDELPNFEYSTIIISPLSAIGIINGNQMLIENLEADTEVIIQVTAKNNGPEECNESSSTLSCNTAACDLPDIDLGNFTDRVLCQSDFGVPSIQFNIVPPAGISGVYSSDGVNSAGFVDLTDPLFNNPGVYPITYTFTEISSACSDSRDISITIEPEINIQLENNLQICLGDTKEITVQASGGDGGPYNYDWSDGSTSASITLPLQGQTTAGEYSIKVTVTDNSTPCVKEETINYSILDDVPIIIELIASCNNNGTELDLTDDFYDVFVNAQKDQSASSGRYSISIGGIVIANYQYNMGFVFQLPSDGSEPELVFTDLDDHMCSNSEMIGPLNPCEPLCEIQTSSTLLCDDKGTTDPDDDFYSINIVAFVTNPGASNRFNLFVDGELIGEFDYSSGGQFTHPATGDIDVLLQDLDKSDCEVASTITLTPCSFEKHECPMGAFDGLSMLGPIKASAISTKNISTAAQSFDLQNDKISKLSIVAARDELKSICDSDSSEFEIKFYDDNNGFPGNILVELSAKSKADSLWLWTDPNDNIEKTIVNYELELDKIINISEGWFSVSSNNEACELVWVSGDNSPVTGAAILDSSGVWKGIRSLNYCFYFEQVSNSEINFEGILIYPNPVTDILHIDNLNKISQMHLYDIQGKRLLEKSVDKSSMKIDMNNYSRSIYLLSLEDDDGIIKTYKVFKE